MPTKWRRTPSAGRHDLCHKYGTAPPLRRMCCAKGQRRSPGPVDTPNRASPPSSHTLIYRPQIGNHYPLSTVRLPCLAHRYTARLYPAHPCAPRKLPFGGGLEPRARSNGTGDHPPHHGQARRQRMYATDREAATDQRSISGGTDRHGPRGGLIWQRRRPGTRSRVISSALNRRADGGTELAEER